MFNFSTNTLDGFNILGYMGEKDNLTKNGVNYYKFANNNLRVLNQSAEVFNGFANEVLNKTETLGIPNFADDLTDYSTQYIQGMLEAAGMVS